jgi:hypothetical protein
LLEGSFLFLFKFALAELAGMKLTGLLARIDSPLKAVRTSPRLFHDSKGSQRPVWIHSPPHDGSLAAPAFNQGFKFMKTISDRERGEYRERLRNSLCPLRLFIHMKPVVSLDIFKATLASSDWFNHSGEARDPVKAKGR